MNQYNFRKIFGKYPLSVGSSKIWGDDEDDFGLGFRVVKPINWDNNKWTTKPWNYPKSDRKLHELGTNVSGIYRKRNF